MNNKNYALSAFLGMLLVIFSLICWIAFATPARAGQWEFSAGMTHFTPTADGTWWQASPNTPYHLTLNALSFGVDYRWKIARDWHMVAGYQNLGNASFAATWVPDPMFNVTKHTSETSMGVMHAHGWGNVQGVYLVPEYTLHFGHGVTEDVMAGPWFYYPRMDVVVPDAIMGPNTRRSLNLDAHDHIRVGYMAAMQVNVDNVGARVSVFDARAAQNGVCVPGIYDGPAYNASLVWRW